MNTAIPFAVELRKIEPSSDSAAITSTANTRPRPGPSGSSGHQSPVMPVISIAAT
jgi:hypothetical protein